jgi:hypothetical protein
MKKFIVFHVPSSKHWTFDTTTEVACFMRGKRLSQYTIFIKAENLSSEIVEMEEELEHMSRETDLLL